MSANFPQGGAMDQHFGNMRSLIQVGVVLLMRFSTRPSTLRGIELHLPPHRCCVPQPGPLFSLGRSPSPRSWTFVCSNYWRTLDSRSRGPCFNSHPLFQTSAT